MSKISSETRPGMTPQEYIQSSVVTEDMMHNYRLEDFSHEDIICAGNAYGNSDACQGLIFGIF